MLIFNRWSREQDVNQDDRAAAAALQVAGRAGDYSLRFRDDVRGDRLGHVHFAALGVHDLRFSVRGRPTDFRDVADDRGSGAAVADRADGRADSEAAHFTIWASCC